MDRTVSPALFHCLCDTQGPEHCNTSHQAKGSGLLFSCSTLNTLTLTLDSNPVEGIVGLSDRDNFVWQLPKLEGLICSHQMVLYDNITDYLSYHPCHHHDVQDKLAQ